MSPQRVQVHAVRLEGGVVLHVGERLGAQTQLLVQPPVVLRERRRLIQEAEVRSLDVEADGGHRSLVRGKGLEDARQEELDGARLCREAGYAGDVEVGRLRSQEKVTVEIDRRFQPAGGIEADRDSGGPFPMVKASMRSASTTSASDASQTKPSGTGWSGSSGICRSTAAEKSRISAR